MTNIGDGRPLRGCALCGGVDDHPRHVLGRTYAERLGPPSDEVVAKVLAAASEADRPRIMRELLGGRGATRHIDCCREAGCPDGSCSVVAAGVEDLRGGELLDHLMGDGRG
jgi:hypothetical protein